MIEALESLFIKVLRAGNILFFFYAVFFAIKMTTGMPADWRFLIIAGTTIGAAMVAGVVALFMKMDDKLEAQGDVLKSVLSSQRDTTGHVAGIYSIAKRVTTKRVVPPQ